MQFKRHPLPIFLSILTLTVVALVAALQTAPTAYADDPSLFFVDSRKIIQADLDGTNDTLIIGAQDFPHGVALDELNGKIYWANTSGKQIRRANFDGTDIEDIITEVNGLEWPIDVEVDAVNGKIYWTDREKPRIQRANLDGSGVETLLSDEDGIVAPQGLALDIANGKFYWTDIDTDMILRADLDGSNIEPIITEGLLVPNDIAIDHVNGKMYYTDEDKNKIKVANLDGTENVVVVGVNLDKPYGIAIDPYNQKLVWTNLGSGIVQRSDLDGNNREDIQSDRGSLYGIAVTQAAVLTATKTVEPTDVPIAPGETITYKIEVANTGGSAATIAIQDAFTDTLSYVGPVTLTPADPDAILAESADDLPTLASNIVLDAGETVTLSVTVEVDEGLAGGTEITNDATITSDEAADVMASHTLTIANVAPVAEDDEYSAVSGEAISIPAPGVLGNDTDLNGDVLTSTIEIEPSNGVVTLSDDGSFTYTSDEDFVGEDSFVYNVGDGEYTDVGTVTINVVADNIAPVAMDDSYTATQNETLTVEAPGVLANDTDADGNPLSAVIETPPLNGTLTLNSDGSFSYEPAADFLGTDTFSYTANDGIDASNVATVTITVTEVDATIYLPVILSPAQ